MMDDDALIAEYEERGVPSDWLDITPERMEPAFRLWYRALPSPKAKNLDGAGQALKDAADYSELFIHNPLVALRDAGIEVDNDARISTIVVNHEKTLERFIMHTMVVVSTNPSTVGITIAKEEEAPEEKAPTV
jgi:hypothetical protein